MSSKSQSKQGDATPRTQPIPCVPYPIPTSVPYLSVSGLPTVRIPLGCSCPEHRDASHPVTISGPPPTPYPLPLDFNYIAISSKSRSKEAEAAPTTQPIPIDVPTKAYRTLTNNAVDQQTPIQWDSPGNMEQKPTQKTSGYKRRRADSS